MSIMTAMYSGVSGIAAEGQALGVVGDNIANSNTIGFKQQRALFRDVLGRTVGSGIRTGGSGVEVADVQQMFVQGTLVSTGVSTDMALSGDGFFVVQGSVGGQTGQYYSRAGNFRLDKDGKLVTPEGLKTMGYAAQADGTMSAALTELEVSTSALPPRVTSTMKITANLDAGATATTWNAADPGGTSNFSTSMTVYDSLGNAHAVDAYFCKTADNAWDYHLLTASDGITAGTAGTQEIGSGALAFDTDGALNTFTEAVPVSVTFAGASAQTIAMDFGSQKSVSPGTGLDGFTQFGAKSNVSDQSQNGYASGGLSGISVDGQGVLMGTYTNGQKIAVGQLAIARFRSNDGLERGGQNLWSSSNSSGAPALGTAGAGGRGAVSGGALEQSNVDIAQQFVEMISHQRAFQASSKTIQTADQMLQEVVNLKR